jgi:hypothetical protein
MREILGLIYHSSKHVSNYRYLNKWYNNSSALENFITIHSLPKAPIKSLLVAYVLTEL